MDDINRTICPHCGRFFTSSGGLYYHRKSAVCGDYTEQDMTRIMARLSEFVTRRHGQSPQAPQGQWQHSPAVAPSNGLTTPMKAPASTPAPVNFSSPQVGASPSSLLAHLNPATRKRFEDEVAETEKRYGAWMREALNMPEPERSERFGKLKNSYNTKQSTTRKKYGIRLRGNRQPEEIEAERVRLLGSMYQSDIWGPYMPPATTSSTPAPNPPASSAPVSSAPQVDSPRKRVRLSEMGGLSGSAASVETTDPTAFLTSSQQPDGLSKMREAHANASHGGTADDPMAIDSDGDADIKETSAGKSDDDEDSESSSSDTEDIPAR